jgi:hypothetical protein
MEYFQDAASLFQSLDLKSNLVKSWISIANIHRQQFHINEARVLLEEAIRIAKDQEDSGNLAAAYGELGCAIRREAHRLQNKQINHPDAIVKLKEARSYLQEALKFAKQTLDPYREADALIDIALLGFYEYKIEHDPKLAKQADEWIRRSYNLAKENSFVLWESRALEMWGNFALEKGDLKKAFGEYYLPACRLVAGVPSERFRDLLSRVESVIAALSDYRQLQDQDLIDELDAIQASLEKNRVKELEKLLRAIQVVRKTVDWRLHDSR